MNDFVSELTNLLRRAVSHYLYSAAYPGVLFSGGLDSGLLAFLVSNIGGRRPLLIVAGAPGSKDVTAAKNAARRMHLPLEVCLFTLEDVENRLDSIIAAAGNTDVLQVSLAIPLFFAVKQAGRLGIDVLVSGQGADELFGGYARYEQLLLHDGPEAVCAEMEEDLRKLMEVTLPCQLSVAEHYGIHMSTPYLDPPIVRFAQSLPLDWKLRPSGGAVVRKWILRQVVRRMGMPSLIVDAKKRAAQYGSGASRFLARLSQSYWRRVEPEISRREASSPRRIQRFLIAKCCRSSNGEDLPT